tara:strand:+ start:2372 stop:2551 length:180 start_codon:yes stop_codon:yes gene_type:complete
MHERGTLSGCSITFNTAVQTYQNGKAETLKPFIFPPVLLGRLQYAVLHSSTRVVILLKR